MILLITGAITPAKDIAKTKLIDSNKRKDQYIQSIKQSIKQAAKVNEMVHSVGENEAVASRKSRNVSIVYCDNSLPNSIIFDEVKNYAKAKHVQLEILSFEGNHERTAKQGKGFGEGEITEYAINNSQFIKEDGYFIKLTGRLSIDNLASIIRKIDVKKMYFNIPNHTMPGLCDTRFYAVPANEYKQYFIDGYNKVDDNGGYYLEHAFTDAIKKNKLKTYNFPLYPLYNGISGSAGSKYTYVGWKSKIKNVLSVFQFYKVR